MGQAAKLILTSDISQYVSLQDLHFSIDYNNDIAILRLSKSFCHYKHFNVFAVVVW